MTLAILPIREAVLHPGTPRPPATPLITGQRRRAHAEDYDTYDPAERALADEWQRGTRALARYNGRPAW